jgi:hypothetical protein
MSPRPALLAVLLAAGAAAPALAAEAPPPPRALRVTGEGRVTVRPDVALLLAGVESTGQDLGKVTRDAAAQMRKVVAALGEAGIPDKDVQTTRHDVQVEREWKNGRQGPIGGYTVSDEVRVTVRDLSKLGPVLDRVTAAGANALHSLAFQKEDPNPDRARALVAAYAAARVKADALAKAAGVALGEVLSLSEAGQAAPIPMRGMVMARAEDAGGTPVQAGEMEIAASVEVVFGLR